MTKLFDWRECEPFERRDDLVRPENWPAFQREGVELRFGPEVIGYTAWAQFIEQLALRRRSAFGSGSF